MKCAFQLWLLFIQSTSYKAVIQKHKENEDDIKDSKSNQELVEGVCDALSQNNNDGEDVPYQSK